MTSVTTIPQSAPGFDFSLFGDRLRWALECKQLTQTELASRLGVTKSAINQSCLSKKVNGGGKHIVDMADLLDVPVTWLQYGIPGDDPTGRRRVQSQPTSLSVLQEATLQSLTKLMLGGQFDDVACLEFLHTMTPSLVQLASSEPPPTEQGS